MTRLLAFCVVLLLAFGASAHEERHEQHGHGGWHDYRAWHPDFHRGYDRRHWYCDPYSQQCYWVWW